MKELTTYINEKLDINKVSLDDRFPIDGTLDDIIESLEENEFVAADESHNYKGTVDDVFDYNKSKCFLKENTRIWFADTSKEEISKKNPIFYVSIPGKLSTSEKILNVYCCDSKDVYQVIEIVENDKKEFLKELNKRFNWE